MLAAVVAVLVWLTAKLGAALCWLWLALDWLCRAVGAWWLVGRGHALADRAAGWWARRTA